MNMSFFVGAIGADACQKKLSVVSNNLANINNYGFKPKTAVFEELLNYNLNDSRDARTELQAGASATVARTSTSVCFDVSPFRATESMTDYALGDKNTFFMLRDPATGEITYTRNGHFHVADMGAEGLLLMTESGKYVLDQNRQPLSAEMQDVERLAREAWGGDNAENEETELDNEDLPHLAVYTLKYPSRLLNVGDNEFAVQEGDTENTVSRVMRPYLQSKAVESSGTDLAREMTRMIEAQRAFQYALRMVTTSDEVEDTINRLRG